MPSALANFLADMRANLANHPRGHHTETLKALTAHQRPCAASSRRVAALEGSDPAVSVVELTIPHEARNA